MQTNFTKGKWYTYPVWYKNKGTDLQVCKRCYDEIFRDKEAWKITNKIWKEQNPEKIKIYRKRWDMKYRKLWDEHNTFFLNYKNKLIRFNSDIKIGVCNWCRAVARIDTKRTHLHHDGDIYNDDNPLSNTIELCTGCHSKETQRLLKLNPMRKRIYKPYKPRINSYL